MYILVTYDVDTTDKFGERRLRRIAKACLDYGQRVQNSVFELSVTEAQLATIKGLLGEIIKKELDSIRIYHLGKNNSRMVDVIGMETAYNVQDALII